MTRLMKIGDKLKISKQAANQTDLNSNDNIESSETRESDSRNASEPCTLRVMGSSPYSASGTALSLFGRFAALPVALLLIIPGVAGGARKFGSPSKRTSITPAGPRRLQERGSQTARPKTGLAFARSLRISVLEIGNVPVGTIAKLRDSLKEASTPPPVNHREVVSGRLTGGPVPIQASLHPLVRHDGEQRWEVQPDALNVSNHHGSAAWKAEVRFGSQSQEGEEFDLRIVASREPLPIGPVSEAVLSRNGLASSDVIRVRRRIITAPFVWISHIDGSPVYGDVPHAVELTAPVSIGSRNSPPRAWIGLAIHPIKPWTDRRWLMVDTTSGSQSVIYGHFGTLGMNNFDEFEVTAFVAWREDFPPRAIGIPQVQWEQYRTRFLAESQVVKAIRWEGAFEIDEIDDIPVVPGTGLQVDEQTDIHGTIDKRRKRTYMDGGGKVWIVCIPKREEPWVAGWTQTILPAGRWAVNAAQLW